LSLSAPVVVVNELHYTYPPPLPDAAAVEVLRGVNLAIRPGEFVALLGRVGAGKTTLCMALNGLVPHVTGGVFRGDVTVAAQNTKHHAVAELARTVGLVFQDAEAQLTQMRVEDEVAFGPENLGLPVQEIAARVAWALAAVGLTEHRDRSPHRLSGGEKQRVAIAAMLAMRPQLLVLDEPTANLDPAGKSGVFNVLLHLARERQVAIVIATQEVERAARYADRVIVLHEGRCAFDGPPSTVFSAASQLLDWGLSVPEMVELGERLALPAEACAGVSGAYRALRRALRDRRAVQGGALLQPPEPAAPHASQADEPQIFIENLSYVYGDGAAALRGVHLAVSRGEFLALVGPNGSGKTTLAKHLNGLLKPARGRVLVDGRDTRQLRVAELAHAVGYVFQNPDHQIFAGTVEEEIAFGLRLQGLAPARVAERVDAAVEQFRLAEHRGLPPAVLGSGERRLVALAAVMALQPDILILDEPTGGLDRRSREELMAAVSAYHSAGHTVVLIAHDMRLVAEHATRAAVMLDGRVLFDGPPAELFTRRAVLRQARLAAPPVVRLAQRLECYGLPPGIVSLDQFVAAWSRLPAAEAGP
jgi:energy-coupling factor transport system ATP-binding protein